MVPVGVRRRVPLVYSNFWPGLSKGCCPTRPRPLMRSVWPLASLTFQVREITCAGTSPTLVMVTV